MTSNIGKTNQRVLGGLAVEIRIQAKGLMYQAHDLEASVNSNAYKAALRMVTMNMVRAGVARITTEEFEFLKTFSPEKQS